CVANAGPYLRSLHDRWRAVLGSCTGLPRRAIFRRLRDPRVDTTAGALALATQTRIYRSMSPAVSPATIEGWYALHQVFRVNWNAVHARDERVAAALHDALSFFEPSDPEA